MAQEVLEVCYQTTTDLYAQLSRQNQKFKAMADSYLSFRSDEYRGGRWRNIRSTIS